jgi:DMSO/TMAO reductase YedYZ molybdopterin-dependent catalytic subunit
VLNNIFQRKEDEVNYRKEGRLPPGQAMTKKFPVLHYGPVPRFDPSSWDFKIWGEVAEPLHLSWQEFEQLPRTKITLDLHCVTAWSKLDTQWEGVSLRTLIEKGMLRLLPSAQFVLQHAEYGFTANLPLDVVLQDNFLLATHFNGEPLSPDHGYPLRGVVGAIPNRPDLKTPYLWKGAKWLRGIEFLAQDKPGFWERAGYHNEADIWKEQRFG